MKYLALFLFLFMAHTSYSQTIGDTSLLRQSFLFEEFISGTVVLKSGEVNRAPLNYCSYDQDIVFKTDGQTMSLDNLESIDSIFIGNRRFVPFENKVFEVVDDRSKVQLYVSYVSKMIPWTSTTDKNGSTMKLNREASNTVSSVYVTRPYKGEFSIQVMKKFWLKSFNKLHKANSVKDFLKVFKEATNPSIEEFAKANKIDFEKEEDLIKLVDFANKK